VVNKEIKNNLLNVRTLRQQRVATGSADNIEQRGPVIVKADNLYLL